ncbi:hypothetical protein ACV3UL_14240 [Clostridium perfringens]
MKKIETRKKFILFNLVIGGLAIVNAAEYSNTILASIGMIMLSIGSFSMLPPKNKFKNIRFLITIISLSLLSGLFLSEKTMAIGAIALLSLLYLGSNVALDLEL